MEVKKARSVLNLVSPSQQTMMAYTGQDNPYQKESISELQERMQLPSQGKKPKARLALANLKTAPGSASGSPEEECNFFKLQEEPHWEEEMTEEDHQK